MLAFLIILPPRAIREQQAVPVKPSDCISSARQLEVIVFYLTAAAFFLPLSASQGIPPKLLRRRYQNCESLLTPRAEWVRCMVHGAADQDGGFLQATKIPGTRCPSSLGFSCYCSLFLFHPGPIPSFFKCFLFFSSFLCCRQPQTQQELGPSRLLLFFFFPCSRLWLLPLRAGSPKTHDSLTMNNQYRYWSVGNVCKFLKGNQEQGAGRLVGDDAEVLVAVGSRTSFGSQVLPAPRWRYRNACERGCARVSARVTRVVCILLSLQLLSPKNQEPNGREPPSVPCLGCGPALFCFHYHTLLCNLHKYRVIFYRVAQKIEKKNRSLCCVQEGLAAYSSWLRI